MSILRPFFSESSLQVEKETKKPSFFTAKSEPSLSKRKLHPLLDDDFGNKPHSYNELILAAETLENIVMEGTLVGATIRSRLALLGKKAKKDSSQMTNRVLQLVYGSMKCIIIHF